MTHTLTIGTRGSPLALVQSEYVAAELRRLHPAYTVTLQVITTTGDRVLDVALSQVGDKGLFVKEIEHALLDGSVQLAVHSGKDMPSQQPDGLMLAAFPRRANPHDALVLRANLALTHPVTLGSLPTGAVVGTSSLRRISQLRALRPDVTVKDVRGNLVTRLHKLDSGQYDALILAAAGLERQGLPERISSIIDSNAMLPAVAQGALAIEVRSDDHATRELVAALDDAHTRTAVLAERAMLRRLEGGCQVPIAAHATLDDSGDSLHLRGLVAALDGSRIIRGERRGATRDAVQLGTDLADELIAQGAMRLIPRDTHEGTRDA